MPQGFLIPLSAGAIFNFVPPELGRLMRLLIKAHSMREIANARE